MPEARESQQEREEARGEDRLQRPRPGDGADIKVAMVDLAPRLDPLGADMIMQVHDELVFDVDEEHVDESPSSP